MEPCCARTMVRREVFNEQTFIGYDNTSAGPMTDESGRGQPHSTTGRRFECAPYLAKRRGVRLPSAAFPPDHARCRLLIRKRTHRRPNLSNSFPCIPPNPPLLKTQMTSPP
jgi:hypothetical protein